MGDARVPASAVIGADVTLTHLRLQRRYHQLGKPPGTLISFGVPLSPMNDWFGRPYALQSLLPFDLPDGIDGTSEGPFEAMTISISRARLSDLSSGCQMSALDTLTTLKSGAFLADSVAVRRFRRLLTGIMATQGRLLDRDSEEALALALLEAASSPTQRRERSTPSQRQQALNRALTLIEDETDEALTVADVCRRTGVSLRTMNRAFRERFAIGPKAYLVRQRLNRLRNALLTAPPETMIADLANDHGFWHLGQLAKVYRATFGELPSETLYSGRAAASRRWA
jgi:AraC-like DNA-binding protein